MMAIAALLAFIVALVIICFHKDNSCPFNAFNRPFDVDACTDCPRAHICDGTMGEDL
jgi:hypothetical protein